VLDMKIDFRLILHYYFFGASFTETGEWMRISPTTPDRNNPTSPS